MKSLILALTIAVLPVLPAAAQDWALQGFDPVGYLQDGRAMPGRTDIATTWQDKVWHFDSEEHRALFEANPRSYAPAFDGLCPVALSEGRFEEGNPQYFAVIERRVYLLRSDAAQRQFADAPADIIANARANWAQRKN